MAGGITRVLSDPHNQPTIKLAIIAILCLASLLPLQSIRALVLERQQTGASATQQIARAWGGEQRLIGPVLVVPYMERGRVQGERRKTLIALPESLSIETVASTQTRHRSIYETVVYDATTVLSGNFAFPDLSALDIAPENVLWREARLDILVSELSGIVEAREASLADAVLAFRVPHAGRDTISAAATLPGEASDWPLRFSVTLDIRGSDSLGFLPVGERTSLALSANWAHPSFVGAHLPAAVAIDDDAFEATWKISRFARALPPAWSSDNDTADELRQHLASNAVVTRLVDPVDHYLKSERSVKYGLLFVILVACTLFVFESVSRLRFHPLQYAMVVAALCLFFLLLLSLSEVLGFAAGYAIAATLTVALLGHYVAAIAHGRGRGAMLAGLLGAVYAALFVVLHSEAHALLLGSGLLFIALALTMVLTRNLDWYALGARPESEGKA